MMAHYALLSVTVLLWFGTCEPGTPWIDQPNAECPEPPECSEHLVYLFEEDGSCGKCPDSFTGDPKICKIKGANNYKHGDEATLFETSECTKCHCYDGNIYCTKCATCKVGNTVYEHDEEIPTTKPCEVGCKCNNGTNVCSMNDCPECENPEYTPGQCCPRCV